MLNAVETCEVGIESVGGIGMVQSLPERGWRRRTSLVGDRIVR